MSTIERAIDRLGQRDPAQEQDEGERPQASPDARQPVPAEKEQWHVDLDRLEQEGLLTPKTAQGPLAEEYRLIKRPLLMNAFGQGAAPVARGNLIMVTSALPGEGKTFTSMNLAASISMELDATVLLVDGDAAKSSITHMLGLKKAPGLIDVLLDDKLDLGDVIVPTDVPKFRVLPAGRFHKNATELMASEQMRRLVEELASRYSDRVILFDAPPLLVTSQTSVLARLMGQVVLVVEAGKTPQQAVEAAAVQLGQDNVVGVVLNKRRHSTGEYYYGYYGSY